jgi:hypothetical protein
VLHRPVESALIVRLSAVLGVAPTELDTLHVHEARAAGLTDAETLDLVHAVALFAWANRLMLNLGDPSIWTARRPREDACDSLYRRTSLGAP